MRDRFSVADMACLLGIWDAACVDGLLSEAEASRGPHDAHDETLQQKCA